MIRRSPAVVVSLALFLAVRTGAAGDHEGRPYGW
jgi:hypothetical protein